MSTPLHWIIAALVILGVGALAADESGPSEPEAAQLAADDLQDAIKTAQAAKESP